MKETFKDQRDKHTPMLQDNTERDTYFFYAEQRSSTDESCRNNYPMAIIPEYDKRVRCQRTKNLDVKRVFDRGIGIPMSCSHTPIPSWEHEIFDSWNEMRL